MLALAVFVEQVNFFFSPFTSEVCLPSCSAARPLSHFSSDGLWTPNGCFQGPGGVMSFLANVELGQLINPPGRVIKDQEECGKVCV